VPNDNFPFSNMYHHSVLVLGIVSVLCVFKFHFVFNRSYSCADPYFPLFFEIVHTRLLCVFTTNEWI